MKINNGFNILPWYDSLEKQNCKKWYAYGQAWPLLCPQGFILPFQFISDTAITISSNIYAISVETGQTIDLGVKPTVTEINRADITYYIVKLVSTSIVNLPIGRYNLRMNTSEGFLYSEELVVINNANECIKVEYWNEDTLKFTSGEINFTDDFHFIFYINSTIGKPEYEFEEELTKRLGYKFIESQTSNKVYKFSFVAPEYICDAMRLIRMCDYIKLTTKFDSYNALSFAYEPKWQEQGDLAAVDVEFDTDCIIQKLESFNRRAKESFYNALLADIDEPVLFSTDTVAQYYTEYTTSGTISGKLIRQLTAISEDELVSSLSSIVLPVDNQSDNSQVAKKVFLSDIVNKLIPKVNLSEYLLKSVWDKVFEIRTDRQGKEYIFGKLPVVTQYGITMYADGGDIDLPSLYAGLPIDGKTLIRDEKGVLMVNPDIELGGGVSNFWDLSGIPSWITNSKPKYSYSEIKGTPDLSVYAQVDALKAYVTLAGAQTLTGEKNFTGGLKVNGSPIIYDSANKYWKLQGNLVLTGGITMYADDGTLNLPSIYDGLPIDGTTIYWDTDAAGNRVIKAVIGGGTADSVAWVNITGKPTWIGSSKPVYSYSEIQGTPDLSVYALKTQIPSLSGYATESWVTKQNYATKATTLSGYGITDAYTKTNVDDLLLSYVTLGGKQTITGEKNFTGGLKVNGSPIYYDSAKKYWKLEGDLLVTGGVTMYGNEGTYTPSTIMDAIAVDGTTISKSGGVLKVIGGTGGGVAWANITGKPTWIGSSKPTYSYSEITGAISTTELQNYLTQNSYLNVTSGDNRYLLLSGGTLDGVLTLRASNSSSNSWIEFSNKSNSVVHKLGVRRPESSYGLQYYNGSEYYKIWHEGNDGSGSGLDADLLDGLHNGELTALVLSKYSDTWDYSLGNPGLSVFSDWNNTQSLASYFYGISIESVDNRYRTAIATPLWGNGLYWRRYSEGDWQEDWRCLVDSYNIGSYNAGSATQVMINYSYNQDINYPLVFTSRDNIGSAKNGSMYIDFSGRPTYNPKSDTLTVGNLLGNASSANVLATSYKENINYSAYHSALKLIYNTQNDNYGFPSLYVSGLSVMAGYTGWQLMSHGGAAENPYFRSLQDTGAWKPWRQIAFLTDNVASATRLQTARTIWGQSFDGSSNVDGDFTQTKGGSYGGPYGGQNFYIYNKVTSDVPERYGVLRWAFDDYATFRRLDIISKDFDVTNTIISFLHNGNVGIGTENPQQKLHVVGNIWSSADIGAGAKIQAFGNLIANGRAGIGLENPTTKLHVLESSTHTAAKFETYAAQSVLTITKRDGISWALGVGIKDNGDSFGWWTTTGQKCVASLDVSGNFLVNGGVTMYSDQRKKTILNHVELSLKDIANAPLIEHYYNSDDAKTTHVGSIAQYWAGMNDWFCKLDSEGYYTMEIQNAALASAISIARELDRYETKTDKAIKKLKKRICELEEEVERLKSE